MKPIYIHSGMAGAPQYANADGNIIGILEACLVNGFNTKTATSASASGGVLTLNFAANPSFEALQTVEVAVANVDMVNGQHRVVANANNQVTIAIPGLPDGTVGSSGAGITIKQAGAGWSKPFSSSTVAVFRPPAGNRRYVRCVHAAGADFKARGYEEMTDVGTGTGMFPTVTQSSTTPLAVYTVGVAAAANAPWFVIATDKWFVFSMADAPVANYHAGLLFFGDLADPVQVNDLYSTLLHSQFGSYMPRSFTGVTGALPVNIDYGIAGGSWPSPIAEGLRLVPYLKVYQPTGENLRGVLPNMYKSLPAAPTSHVLNMYSNIAGLSGRAKPVGMQAAGTALMCAVAVDEEAWA